MRIWGSAIGHQSVAIGSSLSLYPGVGLLEAGIVAMIIFALLMPVAVLTKMSFRRRAPLRSGFSQSESMRSRPEQDDPVLANLRERFARGGIDEDEYSARLLVLEPREP